MKMVPLTIEERKRAADFIKYKVDPVDMPWGMTSIDRLLLWGKRWRDGFDCRLYSESDIIQVWIRFDEAYRFEYERMRKEKRKYLVLYSKLEVEWAHWMDEMQARAEMLYEHQKEQEYLNNKENQS